MAILFEIPGVDVKISFHVATQESSARVLKKYLSNFGHRVWICVDDSAAGSSKRHTTAGAGSASILLMNPEWLNSLECEMERKMIIQRVTQDKNLSTISLHFPNLDARNEMLILLQAFASTIIHVKNELITDKDSDILQDILKAVNKSVQGRSASNKQNVPLLKDHKPASECDKCKSPALSHYCPECALQFCEACGTSYHSKGARVKHKMKLLEKCQDCENALAELSCAICELLYCGDCSNFAHSRKPHPVAQLIIAGVRDQVVDDTSKSSLAGITAERRLSPRHHQQPVCQKTSCISQLPAALYCAQCKKVYCEPCFKLFHSKGNRISHDPKPLEKCDDCGDLAILSCVECAVLYCAPCAADAHANVNHTTLPITREEYQSLQGESSGFTTISDPMPMPASLGVGFNMENGSEKEKKREEKDEREKNQSVETNGKEKETRKDERRTRLCEASASNSRKNLTLKAGQSAQERTKQQVPHDAIQNVLHEVPEKFLETSESHEKPITKKQAGGNEVEQHQYTTEHSYAEMKPKIQDEQSASGDINGLKASEWNEWKEQKRKHQRKKLQENQQHKLIESTEQKDLLAKEIKLKGKREIDGEK
eukprot:TRINITY_DN2874_c2_g1::TRINITY_DN2874_c2_g1_i3::g.5531::m.5531 TRINITY_DN2874_c2_g1::TRINITY_DN2874_c2_g1_i3::g.5531  ORF type:complete len:613 (-),score=51.16,zf-B_box/PF00643.19/0.0005,zf-B_box/PF00643.19/0.00047,zf-B_box/PF00643.19/0.046,zf-B_box/PF00643.19/8.2e-05,TIR_2/PF13676.1/0.17,ADK_lid/PF05191.9/1.3e+02,ADK_lid/PF05191.9/0.14,ADK_lid/PF05191.9/1.2e+04,ADK_lid/PF05191.9/21,Peptidase_S64/PF08192.6/4.2 TRINITY_DN2874_c2_g1_i3:217-2013(-)